MLHLSGVGELLLQPGEALARVLNAGPLVRPLARQLLLPFPLQSQLACHLQHHLQARQAFHLPVNKIFDDKKAV